MTDDDVCWAALGLLKESQDGVPDRLPLVVALRSPELSPRAAAVVEVVIAVRGVLDGRRGDDLARPLDAVLADDRVRRDPLLAAVVLAVRTTTHRGTDLDRAIADFARTQVLLPPTVPDGLLERRLVGITLNSLTLVAAQLGLVDEALELNARSRSLEEATRGTLAPDQDGGPAAVNGLVIRVEQALLPLLQHHEPAPTMLLAARDDLLGVRGLACVIGSRQDAVAVATAVIDAHLADPAQAWAALHALPGWSTNTFLAVRRLWVCAAARALTRLVRDGGATPADVELVRSAHEVLVAQGLTLSNLDAVASAEHLHLERALRDAGRPHEVESALERREEQTGALLELAHAGMVAAVRAHAVGELLREQNAELVVRTEVDALTGTGSRYRLEQALADLTHRHPGSPVGVVIADVDRFKAINDDLGHLVGDAVLHRVGELLSAAVREGDLLFRYGGDEFVVLLPGAAAAAAAECASRLEAAVATARWDDLHRGLRVALSAGSSASSETPLDVLGHADDVLRARKLARSGSARRP